MKGKVIALWFVLVLLVGCATPTPQVMQSSAPPPVEERHYDNAATTASAVGEAAWGGDVQTKMIIYNAELSLVVKDSEAAQENIGRVVEELGGYVSHSNSYTYSGGLRRITLTLRLPADKFNVMLTTLREMASEVTREIIGTQDVTQEYVDLEARLRALEAKAARLEELMAQAEDTEAVLAVYEQLSQTQIEIEQTKGRMQYLERSTALATITVTLTPDELAQPLEVAGWRPLGIAKESLQTLIRVFQWLIGVLIRLVIVGVPILAFLGGLLYLVLKLLGWLFGRGKRTPKTPPTTS